MLSLPGNVGVYTYRRGLCVAYPFWRAMREPVTVG